MAYVFSFRNVFSNVLAATVSLNNTAAVVGELFVYARIVFAQVWSEFERSTARASKQLTGGNHYYFVFYVSVVDNGRAATLRN